LIPGLKRRAKLRRRYASKICAQEWFYTSTSNVSVEDGTIQSSLRDGVVGVVDPGVETPG
jgi:hypothetical protein